MDFSIAILKKYHDEGFLVRVSLATLFINQILKVITEKGKIDSNLGLKNSQYFSALQIGAISHIMMILEDVALFSRTFEKNELNYYQFLDSKELDLGKIIGEFYSNCEDFKNINVRKILSYINPNDYPFQSKEEKDQVSSAIRKNIETMCMFLAKLRIFYENHIKIFRRYKHAGFPIMLGESKPKEFPGLENFNFISYGLTSKQSPGDEMIMIPFSKNSILSYAQLLEDISKTFLPTIRARLIVLEQGIDGVFPFYDGLFSERLNEKEKEPLKKYWEDYRKNTKKEQFTVEITPLAMNGPWYKYLDSHYSKDLLSFIKEILRKSRN